MEIADLISRFGSSRHSLRGVAYASHAPFREVPFRATFVMLRTDSALSVEASVQPDGGDAVALELVVPFGAIRLRGAQAELRSGPTGLATGSIVTNGAGFEFLGRMSAGTSCSGHLEFLSFRSFALSGMLEFPGYCLAFSARDADTWSEAHSAKVHTLPSRS